LSSSVAKNFFAASAISPVALPATGFACARLSNPGQAPSTAKAKARMRLIFTRYSVVARRTSVKAMLIEQINGINLESFQRGCSNLFDVSWQPVPSLVDLL